MQDIGILIMIGLFIWLLIKQASIEVWAITFSFTALFMFKYDVLGPFTQTFVWLMCGLFILGAINPLRRKFVSHYLFKVVGQALPKMSATEREALEAGTTGWEANLFSGEPDFEILRKEPNIRLRSDEQAFIDGPVHRLCRMIDDWDITHNRTDMPQEVWKYIREEGFLGMIIPKQYGGLEFSATAVMSVLTILYGRSVTVATTVAVPNSLGPAELLLNYGTEEQKDYYLPRLAHGLDLPCFALTGPNAGSDAASIPDQGVVTYGEFQGKQVLGIRVSWDKRYITLCPVATLIGLAFRLFDPENILGKGHDLGICCALIPVETPGVIKGRRHFPLNIAFLNGPTQGQDVFIPLDYLIGGEKMVGQGWRMLMECLSAGRAISLPSSASGGAQSAAMASGAYARIRKQFNQPIGYFEGIEEPLARIAGITYIIDASLTMTAGDIDRGQKSAVAGAILKYHATEGSRQVALDAMDIHGGKGICLGPNNYLGRGYQGAPISITVEGANILTRSLIIFGQGAIRSHPYVLKEIESIRNQNLSAFDKAIWGHFQFILSNWMKSFIFIFTDAKLTKAPAGVTKCYYQLIHRYSSNLAFLADFCMLSLGAQLKRMEKISARLGDLLSCLYLASGVLKRFYQDGEPQGDLPLVHWCCQQLLHECELAIQGIITNFPTRWGRIALKLMLQPWGRLRLAPSDNLGKKLARLLMHPNESRTRLTRFVFREPLENCPLGRLEQAFHQICAVEELEKRVLKGVKEGRIHSLSPLDRIQEAESVQILTSEEAQQLITAELARQEVLAVDDFSYQDLAHSIIVEPKMNVRVEKAVLKE